MEHIQIGDHITFKREKVTYKATVVRHYTNSVLVEDITPSLTINNDSVKRTVVGYNNILKKK
jgi:ASC-1-like (ASCH) protein